jgi:hypothetical protein
MKTPANIGATADGSVTSTARSAATGREEDDAEATVRDDHQEEPGSLRGLGPTTRRE